MSFGQNSQAGSFADRDEDSLMPMKWYVVHTYSGHENKAQAVAPRPRAPGVAAPRSSATSSSRPRPCVELVKGQKRSTTRKFFPGYMFVQMELDQETFHLVKNTPEDHRLPRRHEPAAGQGDGDPEHQRRDDGGRRHAQAAHLLRGGRERPRHRRAVRQLHRHGRRGEGGEAEGPRQRVDLRPRHAGRARFRSGRESRESKADAS